VFDGGKVDDGLNAVDGAVERIGVREIADDDLGARVAKGIGGAVRPQQGAYPPAFGRQALNEMAADEPGGPGHEHRRGCS
jgi:hypothetical protein